MKPFRLCLLAALFTVCLLGQDAPEIRAHTFEVGAFPGASYGIDDFRFQFGANVSYAFTKHLLPYVEYSYFPGIEHSRQNPALPKTIDTFTLNIHDFHAGLHYRFTIPESRFAPYLAFGMGTVFTECQVRREPRLGDRETIVETGMKVVDVEREGEGKE